MGVMLLDNKLMSVSQEGNMNSYINMRIKNIITE